MRAVGPGAVGRVAAAGSLLMTVLGKDLVGQNWDLIL